MNLEEGLPIIILALTVKASLSHLSVCRWMLTQRYLLPSDTGTWITWDWSLSCCPPSSICLLKRMNRRASQYLVWALSQSWPVKARQELMSQPRLHTAIVRVPSKEMKMRERHAVALHVALIFTPQFCWRHCCSERTEEEGAWAPQKQHTYIFNRLNFTYCLNGSCIFNDSLSSWHGNRYPAIVGLQWELSLVAGISWDKVNMKQSDHPAASPELQGDVLKAQEPTGDAAGLRFSGHWFMVLLQLKTAPKWVCAEITGRWTRKVHIQSFGAELFISGPQLSVKFPMMPKILLQGIWRLRNRQ